MTEQDRLSRLSKDNALLWLVGPVGRERLGYATRHFDCGCCPTVCTLTDLDDRSSVMETDLLAPCAWRWASHASITNQFL